MRILFVLPFLLLMLPTVGLAQTTAFDAEGKPTTRHAIVPPSAAGLRELFHYTGERLPLVSAHRGGPERELPENCLATFENTLQEAFAILEIDPRCTRDGAIVVHHDATLDRTTTGKGLVADQTLQELKELRLKDASGTVTPFRIPTLDEVLQWARGKTILVLDDKGLSIEARVKKIEQHRAESYAILIVYSFQSARQCHELNRDIMMEVMIPNRAKFHEFEKTGIPWSNVVAFVGHTPPEDNELLQMIHEKGSCCIVGTSRNLDREFLADQGSGTSALEPQYRALLESGADLIETDLPREVWKLLYDTSAVPSSKSQFFRHPNPSQ